MAPWTGSAGDANSQQGERVEGGAPVPRSRARPSVTQLGERTERLIVSRRDIPFVVLAVILALVGVAAVLAVRQYHDNKDAAVNELRSRVVVAAVTFNAYFAGDLATLSSMAASTPVIEADEKEIHAYLRRVAPPGNATFTGGLGWIDAKGQARASSSLATLARPVDVSDREYFRRVVATNKPYVSAGLVARRTGLRIVVMAVPTHDASGKINGVLSGSIRVRPTPANRSTVELGYSGLVILDRKGQAIITGLGAPRNRSLARQLKQKRTGTLTDVRGLDGASGHVVVWASSPIAGWTVAIDRTQSSVFAASRRALILDLALIAGLAAILIALIAWLSRRAQREARIQQRHLDHERDIAVRLQRSMLPASLPVVDGLDLGCRYQAAGEGIEVGGDWYDVVARDDGLVLAIVGDVAGRGIAAATLMGQMRSSFHAYAFDHASPSEVLRRMLRLVPEGAMATAVCMSVDPYTGDLRYASAGHLPPLTIDAASGPVAVHEIGGAPPLGFASPDSLRDVKVALGLGSTLIAYTDGLIERRTENIDVGIGRVARALTSGRALGADELAGAVLDEVGGSASLEDDVALLVVKLGAVPSRLAIEIPARAHALAGLRRRLRRWLTLLGVGEDDREDAILAISEACSNSIEHGYERSEGLISLTVAHAEDSLQMVVRDRGRWRMRGRTAPGRGRGLVIMRAVMRTVDVAADEHGTTVTLEKPLAR
jgi:serine phosphatase RsbU (regulator of sigma subunit)/anti-sigma regulatory factor (Ser/Thr protein kinase)